MSGIGFTSKKLSDTSFMPQMSVAFSGWFSDIILIKITQSNVGGFITNTDEKITFKGVIQPLSPEQIELKPEGQRSFTWLQIHALTGTLNLSNDDRIMFDDNRYKVMAIKNYKLNNYIEYHVIEDYE